MRIQKAMGTAPNSMRTSANVPGLRLVADMTTNDRVERPATMTAQRPDAAHDASRSARTRC
jgi:hypothetical protein